MGPTETARARGQKSDLMLAVGSPPEAESLTMNHTATS